MRFRATGLVAIGLAAIVAACGDTTGGGGGGSTTTFEGIIAGDSTSGMLSGELSLTINTTSLSVASPVSLDVMGTEASVTVTGTLTLNGGSTITLTGTYDTGTHALSVAGGGYTFTGTFSNGTLSGTFTTANGGTGSFSTSSSSGSGAVYSFCGNAVPQQSAEKGATFNLVVNTGTGTASGFAVGNGDGQTTSLNGAVSGSNWNVSFVTAVDGHAGTASGTFTSTSLTGTYSIPANPENGTVSATICQ